MANKLKTSLDHMVLGHYRDVCTVKACGMRRAPPLRALVLAGYSAIIRATMALTLFFFIGGLVALRVHGDSISERTARLEEKDLNYGAEIKELKDDVAHLTHQVDTDEAFGVGAATMVTLLVGIQAFLARRARMDS